MAPRRELCGVARGPIAPLIERLAFIETPKQWGYKFRFGIFDVTDADMALIAQAMKADLKMLAL
ncbi:hypothetical protein J2W23_000766 [Variovorax boronicumulans]|nr:hypothetical protein [Variovorax boronicumulans]